MSLSSLALALAGSRSLSSPALVAPVVAALTGAGASLSVGCCVGADALCVSLALAAGGAARLSVFAAFGPGGVGSCSLSSVAGVAAALRAGASVSWWAGGGASVPLAARLAQRSRACVLSAAALVLFAPGLGSLAAPAPVAVAAGLPVFAFGPLPAAPVGCTGAWSASSLLGLSCWAWSPAQPALF